jgi:hypothetical protein
LEKTHDVEYLIELCGDYDVEFNGFFEDAEKLNPQRVPLPFIINNYFSLANLEKRGFRLGLKFSFIHGIKGPLGY